MCPRLLLWRDTYTRTKKGQLFARSPVLPESDNAAVVFIVFQGIEMKEERKKGDGKKTHN